MMLQRLRLCAHFSDGTMPAHGTDALRFAYRRAGGKATFLPPNRCDSAHNLLGLPGPDPGHFLLVQKVTKNTHRGGTLSMGSLPYVPLPRDDTKGDACPPLESPACPVVVLCSYGHSRGIPQEPCFLCGKSSRPAPKEICPPLTRRQPKSRR